MAKVTYKTYSRIAYGVTRDGKLDYSKKYRLYGGEVFVNGKIVKIIPLINGRTKKEVENRAKQLKKMYENKLKK